MTHLIDCEFCLVQYVPDPVRNEFVNIGVVLRQTMDRKSALVRFTRDWSRVRCLDAEADVRMLAALEVEVQRSSSEPGAVNLPLLDLMEESFSTSVRLSAPKACLTVSPSHELERLMSAYVECRIRQVDGWATRQALYKSMRAHFESAGIWPSMKKDIPVACYTKKGDPLKIDCGLQPNGTMHMYHAVSLDDDLQTAKALAFCMNAMREGVRRVEQAGLEMTAIMEPYNEPKDGSNEKRSEQYHYALGTMKSHEIRVITTDKLRNHQVGEPVP